MQIYRRGADAGRIAAFINIGGSYANLGTSELALALKPGLNTHMEIPAKPKRGVLFEMAAEGVPCIHLLFIKGLATKYGLPWDPTPLPAPTVFVRRD
jgi:poly-gamma-glutamate system protein